MSESDMRQRVVLMLKELDAVPIENPSRPGTPDVNFVGGWLELKWLRQYPVRAETPVKLSRYTKQQKLWLRKRHLAGGFSGLLLQCKKEWMLFRYPEFMEIGDKIPLEEMREMSSENTTKMTNGKLMSWILGYEQDKQQQAFK